MEFRLRQLESDATRGDNADNRMYQKAAAENRAPGTITFGLAANRPADAYMLKYGVNNALYFSTDSAVLSAWTGSAWKSVTLS